MTVDIHVYIYGSLVDNGILINVGLITPCAVVETRGHAIDPSSLWLSC